MLLYNITYIIEDAAAAEWLLWMVEEHIPKVMSTELFVSNRLLRVLDSPNEGVTFCSQFVVEDMKEYETYQHNFAPALAEEANTRFKDKFVSFRTLMEYLA